MRVRVAAATDAMALERLINRAYAVEAFFVDGNRVEEREVRERFERRDGCFLVLDAESSDADARALAGAVWVEVRGARGYLGLLSVDPAHQGRGLSRVMVGAVEQQLRQAGCTHLDIDVVNLREELFPFYEKLGFQRTGTAPFTKPARLRRDAHLILMSKELGTGGA